MEQLILENRHTGERVALRRVMREGVLCLELKGTLPPRNQGPPLHIHHVENEEGHVLAGTLGAVLDGHQIRVGQGQRAKFPAGSPHRWWNESDELLLLEGYSYPLVDLDRYLQAAFEVLNSGAPDRPPCFTWPIWPGDTGIRRRCCSRRAGFKRCWFLPWCWSARCSAATGERVGRGVPTAAPMRRSRRVAQISHRVKRTDPRSFSSYERPFDSGPASVRDVGGPSLRASPSISGARTRNPGSPQGKQEAV